MTENPNDSRPQPGLPEGCVFVGVSLDGFPAKPFFLGRVSVAEDRLDGKKVSVAGRA